MTVGYDVIDEKSKNVVIEAWTKHCFTDNSLRPVNIKKKDEHIYNVFNNLFEEYKKEKGE
jgi:hypothetical protein